jgi:hypothetical protein
MHLEIIGRSRYGKSTFLEHQILNAPGGFVFLEPPSYGPGKPAHRFRKCPCGEVFDMHGPEEVLVHVPHITAAKVNGELPEAAARRR